MIAADPGQGGAAWAVLQYVLGLQQLGHEVYLVEPISPSAVQPKGADLHDSVNARYFMRVVKDFGLRDHAALLLAGSRESCGLPFSRLLKVTRQTDLHLNIAGMLNDDRLIAQVPLRVYLDLDPAFTQMWQSVQGIDMRLQDHTHHVTIGLNIGKPSCPVPTCGCRWITTCQPIVISHWPVSPDISRNALTTVGNWRGYGSIEHGGVLYGQKVHSLREFYPLPTRTTERFCLAMGIHPEEERDLAELARYGWEILDPRTVTATPQDYQRFIQASKAELGIAKSGYVKSGCGWFSDRSLAYLASGKPVLAQNTGFRDHLPTGVGLFSFSSISDILDAVDRVRQDYRRHSRGARELAVEHFDSQKVLAKLLESVGG
jgi:hypothetical protein